MELFIYLLKASGCLATFYLVYYAIFRKLTFFTLNRWYLLASLVMSLVIPLLHIDVQTKVRAADVKPIIINTTTKTIADVNEPLIISQQSQNPVNWLHLANVLYLIIAGVILLKLLISLSGIVYRAIKHGKKQNGYRLINSGSGNNSSFFNLIFLNGNGLDDAEREQVITHELVHARLLHSADNLFSEALKALFWFNPFIYLYSKALHQAHEFEVDKHLALQYNSKNYAQLLLKLSNPAALSISNQFSAYGLKSRVQMLFSSPSAAAKKLAYLFMFPVVAVLVYFFAVNKVYAFTDNTQANNKNFVLVLDAGHGGKASGAITNGVVEKTLALQFINQIKAAANARGIKTVLTRSDDRDVSLANRAATKGDVFVSVHFNMAPAQYADQYNGIKILINKNDYYPQSQKIAQSFVNALGELKGINIDDHVFDNQRIFVLRENKLPAVLLELGYMTNKSDMNFLLGKETRQQLVDKFIDAVIAYKNSVQPKLNGAIAIPDTVFKIKPSITREIADTAIMVKNKHAIKSKKTTVMGHITSLKISYPINDSTSMIGNHLYSGLSFTHWNAMQAVTNDKEKLMVFSGDVNAKNDKFNISAELMRVNLKNGNLVANGNVRLQMRDNKNSATGKILKMDSLTIVLQNHP